MYKERIRGTAITAEERLGLGTKKGLGVQL